LVLRCLAPLSEADAASIRRYADENRLSFFIQTGGPATVRRLWPGVAPPLSYRLPEQNLEFEFEPTDFVQVNAEINQALVNKALELLAPTPDDLVLDLFCGLGNLTLPLAQRAASVIGVEGDAGLVARARHNAARNGIRNVEFFAADLAADRPPAFLGRPYTKLLLDPPRTGALEIVQQLHCETIRRVVYISCNPSTLARDAGVLTRGKGYTLSAAGVLDMFPHTTHVESIAVFDRS
jgi:23S rRNA (uracil1939-C5)-methyltransferase